MQSGSIKKIEGYKIYMGKLLGQGSYGKVYQGVRDNQTNQKVAVKILEKNKINSDPYLKSALLSQIRVMQTAVSQNIVQLYDVLQSPNNYYIVQELCIDGTLQKMIKQKKVLAQPFSQDEAIGLLKQMANGFLALVKEGIIHRDFKPANVMVKKGVLKIGDFGLAKKSRNPSTLSTQTVVGTPLYMPLQILKSSPYSSKCDVWALAAIFYELLHLQTPWKGSSEYQLVQNIQNTKLQLKQSLSQVTKDFLRKCLQKKQEQRLCWDEVFIHKIFENCFDQQATNNKQFEDKMKAIMSELRFHITAQNLDILKILTALGHSKNTKPLNEEDFIEFLQIINSKITPQQSNYIFKQTDLNGDGYVSIDEIQKVMLFHQICLTSIYKKVPVSLKHKTQSINIKDQQFSETICEQKSLKFFTSLFLKLQKQNRKLYDVFIEHDSSKNDQMSLQDFRKMLQAQNKSISFNNEQIRYLFKSINRSHNQRIYFQQLNVYFSRLNSIPPHINRPFYINFNLYNKNVPEEYNMIPFGSSQQSNSTRQINQFYNMAQSSKNKDKKR